MKNTQKPPRVILLALVLVIVVMSMFNYMLDLSVVNSNGESHIKLQRHDADFESVAQCLAVWGTDHKGN